MVEINYKIIIVGLIAITMLEAISMVINKNSSINPIVLFIIAMSIGIIIPSPQIDSKRGMLKW